ncbi:MFS transporter [Halopseudomonas salegens]|uniref:Na+/melibiose symporter n=1 Tax=Halopseudomonas salegens TaxID=1434072 RepID=A0A1H2GJT7_9GAMM|nr:MFS transporter [Halopseudomonas salegens]SDU19699.1 Na+/melibiose symporter [Halopseudomonas salegens]
MHSSVLLPVRTKLAYGLGQVAETIKATGFDIFLFFYFTQVLGLSGTLAGIAVMIALIFDAVTDPLAGYVSDHWRSRFGRRHPFMLVAAVPLGLAWFGLFMPPASLSQLGLFCWLAGFAILVRGTMTLYYVPYLALGAELTADYQERTSVAAWRGICGVLAAALVAVVGLSLFFPDSVEFENGLLNPAGYPKVALAGAIIMVLAILLSAWGTRDRIASLPRASDSLARVPVREDVAAAWHNRSFRALFIGTMLVAVSIGIVQTLNMHLNVYFWQLPSSAIALLAIGLLAGWPVGILLAKPLHRRFDKKRTIIVAALIGPLASNIAVVSRLAGVFPDQDNVLFEPLIFLVLFVSGMAAGLAMTSGASMMADVTQEHQFRTGRRQEGFLFSAVAFTGKMAAAVGYLVAGVGLDLIGFPVQAEPSQVLPEHVTRLALLNLSACLFGFASVSAYCFYSIDRDRQVQTAQELAARDSLL